jgi:hypothetical protein
MTTKITTKYQGPTDTTGSRIVAKCGGKQLSMSYQYELSVGQNHATAAARLASKLKLSGTYGVVESRDNGNVYAVDAKFEAFRVGTANSAKPFSHTVF